jgi:hypothetical protein
LPSNKKILVEALAQVSELIMILRYLGESSKAQEQDAKRIIAKLVKELEDESDNHARPDY